MYAVQQTWDNHHEVAGNGFKTRSFGAQKRLLYAALDYIHAHPRLAALGPDPLVAHLVASKGLTEQHVSIVRLAANGKFVTALCAPTRTFRDPYARRVLLEVKVEAREEHTRCIIVPQRWLKDTVRGGVSRVLAASRNVTYSNRQLASVLRHVRSTRITTVAACASAVPDHPDPYGAVFAMCCAGILAIDRSRPVDDDSWLSGAIRQSEQETGR